MPEFLYKPAPNKDAAAFIAGKKAVSREVFDGLLPELRARAVCITGVDSLAVVQSVRDKIKTLPVGTDWDSIKGDIAQELIPWLDPVRAEKRAELLLRVHGFQAYAQTQYATMQRQTDVFPVWQYQSADDGKVRPGHAALDQKVLPADSPFWQTHFPPWEFGCRCYIAPLTADDVADIERADAKRPPEARRVLSASQRKQIETTGTLLTADAAGMPRSVDVRSPREKQGGSGYHFNPADESLSLADLQARYQTTDPQSWSVFEQWAKRTDTRGRGTVWAWLSGADARRTPVAVIPAPAPSAAAQPGALTPAPAARTLDESLARLGLDQATPATAEQMAALLAELKEEAPLAVSAVVAQIRGRVDGPLARANLETWTQEFLDLVPPSIARNLPPLTILTAPLDQRGLYSSGTVKLSTLHLGDAEQARRTLWHELTHWLHLSRPAGDPWVVSLKRHFEQRTAGETVRQLAGYGRDVRGLRDDWYEAYAGRVYRFAMERTHLGMEVPTRYMELLTLPPEELAVHWNNPTTRETLRLVLSGLYAPIEG